jgi:hypothetical protein
MTLIKFSSSFHRNYLKTSEEARKPDVKMEQMELLEADVFSSTAAINSSLLSAGFLSARIVIAAFTEPMNKFTPICMKHSQAESNRMEIGKRWNRRDNKFSCMIHWISLNACHFLAQHRVQQDLWELILEFFPLSSHSLAASLFP